MNQSRGALYFHRLFSVRELGLGTNPEPFINRVVREFLKIGEAVARCWIEMPQGVLLLQMVPGIPDSGAAYLYDRKQQVFYMLGFDGPDDNLTLEEFNQLLAEYGLLRYAEQPSLVQSPPSPLSLSAMRELQFHNAPNPEMPVQKKLDVTATDRVHFTTKQGVRWYASPGDMQLHLQTAGSA